MSSASESCGPAGLPPPAISAEVFAIPLEDAKHIVYAPLRRAAFVGNSHVVDFISQLKSGVFNPQADPDGSLVRLLRALEIVDAAPERPPAYIAPDEPKPTSITLFLTTACNLRCTYCYASAGRDAPKYMSIETARRGIDFIAANAACLRSPHITVGYHGGGEPTMNWRVLTASLEYARHKAAELKIEMRTALATNGVMSDARIDWVAKNLRNISVSCDGLPEVQDRARPTASGKGSSGRVAHTLHRFDAANLAYALRLTVTADELPTLADSIEYLCAEFHATSIQIEPVYRLGRGAEEASAESDEFVAAYRAASARAMAMGRKVRFSGARVGTATDHFCSATRDNFCLSADGNVTSCFEAFGEDSPVAGVFFYGSPVADGPGYTFDDRVLAHLRAQAIENRAFCRDCFAKWSCGGDCYHKWVAANGPGEFNGSPRCHVIRELTKDQILEKIEQTGGTFWHAVPGSRTRP
jgi:uncharacterized protein